MVCPRRYRRLICLDEMLRALQEGCFRYFQLGGRCIEDPVGLLSGYYVPILSLNVL